MMGKTSFFLGLQISQNPRGIFINQSKYALESLKKYGFESCDPVDTPMVEKSKLDKDREGKAVDPSHYRGATTAEDWVILLGIALPDQGEGMLPIFKLSCSFLKRKKQGFNFKQKNLTSWLLQHDKAPVYDIDGSAEEVDLEAKIKDLENILLKRDQTVQTIRMLNPKPDAFYHPNQKIALGYPNPSYLKKAQLKQQSLYNGNLLLEEHDPPDVYDSEETLELAQEGREKMGFLKKEIKSANYDKINHLSRVFVPQMTKSKEELFLSNVSNMVTVFKMIFIPNEDVSDDTTPSVARKFLNEVKSSLVTLKRVVKQKMTLEIHNWSSSAYKEEADKSLDKQKSLELEIEQLLKASVSHDIMSIVQNVFVDVPSDLQTELDRMSMTPHVDKPKLSTVTPHSKKLHASISSHSIAQHREFNDVKHRNVISPEMFKINPSQTSRVDLVPNKQSSASIRTNPITNSQRHVTFKENPKGNTRNARVPSASKSSEVKKNVTVEDHCKTLLLSKNQKTMSSECNNIKLAIRNDKSEIVYGTCCLNLSVVRRLGLFQAYDREHQASHQLCVEVSGNCLGYNLFLVGQFCDADLEVAFRRNTCFIRYLDGVDLLKGNRSTNLYTINLYDMASAFPICLMARATPTKSRL
nr:uncharacterized mitochondrial protein AtMg00810-like [Tanacetum cinerariifolium]